jgi:hypothetical protein
VYSPPTLAYNPMRIEEQKNQYVAGTFALYSSAELSS